MKTVKFAFILSAAVQSTVAALTASNLKTNVDVLDLDFTFGPVKASYWTGYPHHRRTPFAVSPDGKSAYIAYLDSNETDVHVQPIDPTTFKATGTTVTITGAKEAGGLVAQNDGFAVMVNEPMPSGTENAPPSGTPVAAIYRYTDGTQTWKTWLGGPNVHPDDGLSMSPDINGDLVYSAAAGLYGAYIVVTDYSGNAAGHFGDSIEYVYDNGTLDMIQGASSSWGCSHNTGIAFEAADEAPFASICAEDQGAIWLNSKGTGMMNSGVKISNENTTNGGSGEPMGGMSGSFSGLARFASTTNYIFSWVSRGAIDLTENTWMGSGYTHSINRTNPRNVAIAMLSDKYTKVGAQATSEVGATSGDDQVNWITEGANDCSNAHAATFDTDNALVTWEEISDPICDFIAMGCRGTFAGSFFQQVDSTGAKVGDPLKSTDVYVAGDMVTMSDGRVCWPYVSMTWDLSEAVPYSGSSASTQKMSFACISLDGSASSSSAASSSAAATSSASSVVAGSSVSSVSTTEAAKAASTGSSSVSVVTSPSVSSSVVASSSVVGSATASAAAATTPTTLETIARSSSSVPRIGSTAQSSESSTLVSSAASPQASSGEDGEECGDGSEAASSAPIATATPATSLPVVSAVASSAIASSISSVQASIISALPSSDIPLSSVSAIASSLSSIQASITAAAPSATASVPAHPHGGEGTPTTLAELYQWLSDCLAALKQIMDTKQRR
ncbi:MAG: hypothetical protein M1820_007618 [Bogoriella megaspora]|nr:MAG: hypothetical protein M1820_007618 [Bogoriella megaspora]